MEFKKYKLGEIASFSQGKQVPINEQYEKPSESMKRFIRIVDYTNNEEPTRYVENYGDKYYASKEELVMIRYGSQTAGMVAMGKNGIIANNLFKITLDNSKVLNKYMYYYLSQKKILEYLRRSQSSSTMPAISFELMNNLEVMLPNISNQDKMINLLEKLDKKIEVNSQINNNLHELAENMFKQIYENGIDCKLSDLVSNISTGSRPKGGAEDTGIPSIGAEKIEKFGVYNYNSEKYISESYFNKLKNGIVKSGDVLLYKDGAYTGKVSMALNGFPHKKCAVNEHVFIINTIENWAKYYLYFTLYRKENRNKIFTMASSKAAQPGLNQTELKSLDIKLADKAEIIKFEKRVEPIMFKIANNTLQNKTLEQLRDTLLPKLMNGKIDLNNIKESIYENR